MAIDQLSDPLKIFHRENEFPLTATFGLKIGVHGIPGNFIKP